MKFKLYELMATLALATLIALPVPALAQDAGKSGSAKAAAVARAMESAMTPGDYQKRLEPMIGTFDVRVLIWVDPSKPPIESSASAVSVWVLGNRFVQTMLVGGPSADAFNAIGYIGYDNAAKRYQAAWMDDGSTAMTLYTGGFSADGKSATVKASVTNMITGKPTPLELRLSLGANGGHVTQLWGQGLGTTMYKMMELQYTRTKS